jgi:integrase
MAAPGHIAKHGAGWAAVVDCGKDPVTGKRIRLWRAVRGSRRDAQAVLVKMLAERDQGVAAPPGKQTTSAYLRRWLRDSVAVNCAPKTVRTVTDIVEKHLIPVLGNLPLSRLRPVDIQSYYSRALLSGRLDGKGGLSPVSVQRHHQILHAALRQAVRWQLLARNPADAVDVPHGSRREMPMPSIEDVKRMLAVAENSPIGAIVYVTVQTGLRKGEALGLRWSDVDLDARGLHVQQTAQFISGLGIVFGRPKTTKSARTVALSTDTVRQLTRHRAAQAENRLRFGAAYNDLGLVFATPLGAPIDASHLRRQWLRVCRAANVKLRWHDLRHVHASLLLAQGANPKVVSERLGHSGVAITLNLYSHVLPEIQATEAEKLDQMLRAGSGSAANFG